MSNLSHIENANSTQIQKLIEEIDCTDLNPSTKKKTIDTLNAITGMLESLREKKLFSEE